MKVALVYPPFGPSGVANLALSILCGGIKQKGYPCKVFYWNLDLLDQIPHEDKANIYISLSLQPMFPANEWIFSKILFPDGGPATNEEMRDLFLKSEAVEFEDLQQRQHGFWDMTSKMADQSPQYIDRILDKLVSYDLIGINSSFYQNVPALALAKSLKERWPAKVVVLGGANCHGQMGQTLINQFSFLDYVFLGEADFTFPDLVDRIAQGLDVSDIPGIVRRDGAKVVLHEKHIPIQNLDASPIPEFGDYVEQFCKLGIKDEGTILLPLESSRGCWWGAKHHCLFCGLNEDNLTQRQKSFERFREELEHVSKETGASYFFMTDNIFRWKDLPEYIDWNRESKHGLNFFYEIRPVAKRENIRKLVDAGITMVQPGIEHFSTKILKQIEKHLVGIENIAFLKYAREYGLTPVYNVICLFPGEDVAEYERLEEHLPKVTHLMPPNGLSYVQYHRYSPYFYRPEQFGIKLKPYRGYSYLYPFEDDVLMDFAYLFDLVEPLEVPKGAEHVVGINKVINDWKSNYSDNLCSLTWHSEDQHIVIEDRRDGFPKRSYRLGDAARSLFFALDKPGTLKNTITRIEKFETTDPWLEFQEEFDEYSPEDDSDEHIINAFFSQLRTSKNEPEEDCHITFSGHELSQDPIACLQPFIDHGLVYEEDLKYLSLPVFRGHRRSTPGWKQFDL